MSNVFITEDTGIHKSGYAIEVVSLNDDVALKTY